MPRLNVSNTLSTAVVFSKFMTFLPMFPRSYTHVMRFFHEPNGWMSLTELWTLSRNEIYGKKKQYSKGSKSSSFSISTFPMLVVRVWLKRKNNRLA